MFLHACVWIFTLLSTEIKRNSEQARQASLINGWTTYVDFVPGKYRYIINEQLLVLLVHCLYGDQKKIPILTDRSGVQKRRKK